MYKKLKCDNFDGISYLSLHKTDVKCRLNRIRICGELTDATYSSLWKSGINVHMLSDQIARSTQIHDKTS